VGQSLGLLANLLRSFISHGFADINVQNQQPNTETSKPAQQSDSPQTTLGQG
jgi:hypothetical protein